MRDETQPRMAGVQELGRRHMSEQANVALASEQRDRRMHRAPFFGLVLKRPVDPSHVVCRPERILRSVSQGQYISF